MQYADYEIISMLEKVQIEIDSLSGVVPPEAQAGGKATIISIARQCCKLAMIREQKEIVFSFVKAFPIVADQKFENQELVDYLVKNNFEFS